MSERDVLIELGAATGDETSKAEAQRVTHDHMLAELARVGRRQTSPVRWHWYEGDYAEEALAALRLTEHEHAAGLLEWIQANPGALLVIATVESELLQ